MEPTINLSGRFVLKAPFIAKPEVIYTITAIREFSDLYLQGIDVYTTYYKPAGITNGTNVNDETFDFDAEVKKKPTIVTLEGTDNSVIYVPSNFILVYPNNSEVKYSRIILSADLGALPDNVTLTDIVKELEDYVAARIGTEVVCSIHKAPALRQPTKEEHELLEASRIGASKVTVNPYTENLDLKEQIKVQEETIKTMTKILFENNLLED